MENYRFPEIVAEMHFYWLLGVTGGQQYIGKYGHYTTYFFTDNYAFIMEVMDTPAFPDFDIQLN